MSAYRSADVDLEARRERLAQRLAVVRAQRARDDDDDLVGTERLLLREIAALGLPRQKPRLRVLDRLGLDRVFTLETPCREDWNAMVGSAHVRRCSACDRDVFDLSDMTQAEIDTLLAAHGAPPCVRMTRRADGTLVTKDACPPQPSRVAAGVAFGVATAVVAAGAALAAGEAISHRARPAQIPVTDYAPIEPSHVMGGLRELPVHHGPREPLPPWERRDVIERGFEDVAHFTRVPGAPADDDSDDDLSH